MPFADYFKSLGRFGVVPILGYAGLKTAGLTAQQCCRDQKLHAQLIRSNSLQFTPDAIISLMDLTVEAESYGVSPVLKNYDPAEIRTYQPIENIAIAKQGASTDRMSLMVEAARQASLQVNVPVGFFVTGPFTLAGQVIGIQQLLLGMSRAPERVTKLIENCTTTVVDYARRLTETGIKFLIMADMSSSLISPKQFEQFAKGPISQVARSVSKDIILHICGRTNHLLKQMGETGVSGVSIDQNVKLPDAARSIPSHMLILGNYPPTDLNVEKPETIQANVTNMLMTASGIENVVASTGCDIPSTTPPENISSFIRAVKSYTRKPLS
jgi:uroporphyrinogen decarboxylase